MRIGVIGAGAIGGWIAARLAEAGHEVVVLTRAASAAALRETGLALHAEGRDLQVWPQIAELGQDVAPCDWVFVAVKAFALPDVAPAAIRLAGPDGSVVPLLNGVPWWFMGPEHPLRSVDPAGRVGAAIPYDRVIAAVVHAAATRTAAGVIRLVRADRLILGEPAGGASARIDRLVQLLREAGLPAEASPAVRSDIWYKLWGNMTINPISALTLATADRILDDPLVMGLVGAVMEEARAIGAAIGCPIIESTAARNAITRKLGAFRTSMLQDVEAGRPLELAALLGAPLEIAEGLGMPAPALKLLFGLTRTMAASRGLA